MACWLKQSTAVDVILGPFVDSSDGNTVESALTITQPDIRLSKNGGAFAQKSAAQTLTHGENGWYSVNLSTTDTGTLGTLIVAVHEAGALPVWREFMVVPANVYDSVVSGSDKLEIKRYVASGVTDSGSTTTMTDAARTEADVDYWKGSVIVFTSGGVAGQSRLITAFNPASDTITFAPATSQGVTAAVNYEIHPAGRTDLHFWLGIQANALISGKVDASAQEIAAGAINAAAIAAGAIDDNALAADVDAYHAKIWVVKESTTSDHYAVVFFKNGQPVTSGITSPTIQVIKASDGTDLIASGALTEVGSLGIYKKDESTDKLVAGAICFAKVTATIDGSTRNWLQQIGRDST